MYLPILGGLVGAAMMALMIAFVIKGVVVKKRQACPRGAWTTLICNYAISMPRTFDITFTARDGGRVEGKYIEQRYMWLIPEKPKEGALLPQMSFDRNWSNGIYIVRIFPVSSDLDVTIS